MATPEEENRLCMTVYPNSISKTFNVNETGEPLMLTPYIQGGFYQEAVDAAKVNDIFQTMVRFFSFFFIKIKYSWVSIIHTGLINSSICIF